MDTVIGVFTSLINYCLFDVRFSICITNIELAEIQDVTF